MWPNICKNAKSKYEKIWCLISEIIEKTPHLLFFKKKKVLEILNKYKHREINGVIEKIKHLDYIALTVVMNSLITSKHKFGRQL